MIQLHGHEGTVHSLAITPGGESLVSAGKDGTIRLWGLHGGERARLDAGSAPVLCLAIHPNGRALASGSADKKLKLWDLRTNEIISSEPMSMAAVTGVAWVGRGALLLAACGERARPEQAGELVLRTFEEKAAAPKGRSIEHGLWALAAAKGSTTVAWCGGARCVTAWDISRQGEKVFRQPKPSLTVALSDDARSLASTVDRTIKIWDVEAGRERATLEGHRGLVRTLAFAPGGSLLASGGQDQTVRFWRIGPEGVSAGAVYQWPIGGVHAVAFSPDGLTCAAAGDRGDIWVWDVDE